MPIERNFCPNLNHRRADAPVRFCASCGVIVNGAVRTSSCPTTRHDVARRNQSAFCVDCGEQLIAPRR